MARSRLVWVGGVVAVVLIAVTAFVLTRPDASASTPAVAETSPSASSESSAATTPASGESTVASGGGSAAAQGASISPAEAEQGAKTAIEGYLRTSVALLAKPSNPSDPVAAYASGDALSQIENQALQFDEEGVRLSGQSRLEGFAVTSSDLAASPPTVSVGACVDDTGITVYTPEDPKGIKSTLRSKTLFVVAYADQQWRVVSRTFPDDAAC